MLVCDSGVDHGPVALVVASCCDSQRSTCSNPAKGVALLQQQLALDVADVTLLTVELEGGREVPLVADSSQQRDIIAGSIREFVAAAGGPTDSNTGAVVAPVKATSDGHDADGDGEEDGDADADADAAQQDVATAEDGAPAAGGGGGAGGGAGAGARGEAEDDREGEPAEATAESAPTPAPGAPPPPPPRLNLQKANAELQDRVTQLTSQLQVSMKSGGLVTPSLTLHCTPNTPHTHTQQANTDIKSLRMELSIVARERSEAKTAMTAIERESEAQTSRCAAVVNMGSPHTHCRFAAGLTRTGCGVLCVAVGVVFPQPHTSEPWDCMQTLRH